MDLNLYIEIKQFGFGKVCHSIAYVAYENVPRTEERVKKKN